ncbi:MAG: hypothetical protein K0B08_06235 [Bacteroidales bacterium]|nr:hypothetical protein [Bacteroidales bacterium]
MTSTAEQDLSKQARPGKRPFLCTIVLSMTLTYFLVLALIFLAGTIFSKDISEILAKYDSWNMHSPHHFRWIAWIGTGLLLLSCAGIIVMLIKKRIGFYIFIAAAIVIFALDMIFFKFDWLRYIMHTGFIFITGIVHFSGKCYVLPRK